ncbi:GvpL/GvpF family gas vesicle protein [Nocardia stercoris]|uniref:Uncharacterized protein n=1 Tax=Nocardia stercoris TaxID=2483361 RepID=A0A3M2L4L2_9NOCA|nr:GvpL/GvpF family gas vesicle protein [Nocardia stercoris]RMI31463.1 hypothetical protein EBN03_19180 [Nocardia stercoris]
MMSAASTSTLLRTRYPGSAKQWYSTEVAEVWTLRWCASTTSTKPMRYVEDAILRELLDENAEADRLKDEIHGKPEDATRNARIALGELINQAIEAKRAQDTATVISELEKLEALVNQREPSNEEDAVHLAVLVESARRNELEEALRQLMADWDGRVELDLLGPMAAYDFVTKRVPEE